MRILKLEFNYLKSRSISSKKLLRLKSGFYRLLAIDLKSNHLYGILDDVLKYKSDKQYYKEFYYQGSTYSIAKVRFNLTKSTKIPSLSFFIKLYYNKIGRVTRVCRLKDYGKSWWMVPLKLKK
jgi:hypothetical protein